MGSSATWEKVPIAISLLTKILLIAEWGNLRTLLASPVLATAIVIEALSSNQKRLARRAYWIFVHPCRALDLAGQESTFVPYLGEQKVKCS